VKQYFRPHLSIAELRKKYLKLAKRHHPDRGGDLETMKKINQAYRVALGNEEPGSCKLREPEPERERRVKSRYKDWDYL